MAVVTGLLNVYYAANAVLIGDQIIHPTCYPQTRARLEAAGILVHTVDVGELIKAEGAVTCCSLIFEATPAAG